MQWHVESLRIPEVKILRPRVNEDARGYFSESYNKRTLADVGIHLDFVQDNHVLSKAAGTIRGLHCQTAPFAQVKLVRVLRGRILDVVVDVRRTSPTFGQWVSAEISAAAHNQILVPIGFAHGLCTLEPDTEVMYKVTNYYSPECDKGVRWNDPALNIPWPFPEDQIQISDKDRIQPLLTETNFAF